MDVPFIRTAFNYDTNAASDESGLRCDDPSRTVESQASETDINVIAMRYGLTGVAPVNVRVPLMTDFDAVIDFRSAMDAIIAAERSFMQMSAKVRARFGNDPQQFVEFCDNPENLDEMRKLGLAVPKPVDSGGNGSAV